MNTYILIDRVPHPEPDLMKWATWREANDIHVAHTTLLDGSDVSTVFLGLDHQWGDGPPLLFETCVFLHEDTEPGVELPSGRTLRSSEVQARYSTWAEAELGHIELCERLAHVLPTWKKATT